MTTKEPTARRGPGRPTTPLLSREAIVAAALALIDDGAPLTMRSLARHLGVNAASLYNHTTGIDDVIDGIREGIAAELAAGFGSVAEGWEVGLRTIATAYRDALLAHPHVVPVLAARPVLDPLTLDLYELAASELVRAGWSEADAVAVIWTVESLVLGSALLATGPSRTLPPPDPDAAPDRHPTYRAGEAGAEHHFALALDALVAGLRQDRPSR